MSIEQKFDALLEGFAEPDYQIEDEPSPADGDDQANRRLHRLRHLNRELAQTVEVFDAEIERLTARRDELTHKIGSEIRWVESSLVMYWEACRARDPKGPKVKHLPGGDLSARKQQPEYRFTDEEAFIAWAAENAPAALNQPPPKIDRRVVRQAFPLDPGIGWEPGEVVQLETDIGVVPGLSVVARGEKVTVTPADAL